MDRNAVFFALFALALAAGCKQEEGEVCQRYPNGETDCGEGLTCCGTPQVCPGQPTTNLRGICIAAGTFCDEPVEPVCDDGGVIDAGARDGGPDGAVEPDAGDEDGGADADAGVEDDAGSPDDDAGMSDAGSDAGTDAGSDAGSDAGTDAGVSEDAGADAGA